MRDQKTARLKAGRPVKEPQQKSGGNHGVLAQHVSSGKVGSGWIRIYFGGRVTGLAYRLNVGEGAHQRMNE